jgi:hypothetical protein
MRINKLRRIARATLSEAWFEFDIAYGLRKGRRRTKKFNNSKPPQWGGMPLMNIQPKPHQEMRHA